MSVWLLEVLTPAALARHFALFLLVVAVAMPSLGLVRWVAFVAGVIGTLVSATVAYDPVALFWWSLMIIVSLLRIVFSRDWRLGGKLNGEEAMFHRAVVPGLSAGQVRRLLSAGKWREVVPGTVLTYQGERIAELCFIVRGDVDIVVDEAKVTDCGPGTLIGEIGLSTGDPATATAICATSVRYLGFDVNRLYRLLDNHVELQDAVELAVERSLRAKLHRSNMAAAHPGRRPEVG